MTPPGNLPHGSVVPAQERLDAEARAAAPRVFPGNGLVALCDEVHAIEREVWFIWQKRGHPPHFAHPTEELANAEAMRLAKRFPGNSFLVMRSMRKFRVEVPEEPTPEAAREAVKAMLESCPEVQNARKDQP